MSLPTRGRWFWRQEFYSICSHHMGRTEPGCDLCNTGHWRNVRKRAVGHFIYQHWPNLWRWWVNLPPWKMRWLKFDSLER